MTSDPIADMLTRVRNAIQARHPKVDVPASKLKTEIARILKEEGYITNFKVAEEGAKKTIKIYLKYAHEQLAGDLGDRARLASGLPRVCRADRHPARAGRPGNQHPDHAARRDDGRDAHKEHVGGEILCRVWYEVRTMSRIGKKPIPLPSGVKITGRRATGSDRARRAR